MTRIEQVEFVKSITMAIEKEIITSIEKEVLPAHWDGHELRELLKDKFSAASFIKMSRKRKSEYLNAVVVNNL